MTKTEIERDRNRYTMACRMGSLSTRLELEDKYDFKGALPNEMMLMFDETLDMLESTECAPTK